MTKNTKPETRSEGIDTRNSTHASVMNGNGNGNFSRSLTVNLVFIVDTPPADVPAIVRAVLDGLAGNRGGVGE